jgi:hypothetical protein
VVGLIALRLDVAASTSFIHFGAFSAFTCVNLRVVAMLIRQRREHSPSQRIVAHVVFLAIGTVIDVDLLLHLDGKGRAARVTWLTCGVLCLTYLTRRFRRRPPRDRVRRGRPGPACPRRALSRCRELRYRVVGSSPAHCAATVPAGASAEHCGCMAESGAFVPWPGTGDTG